MGPQAMSDKLGFVNVFSCGAGPTLHRGREMFIPEKDYSDVTAPPDR